MTDLIDVGEREVVGDERDASLGSDLAIGKEIEVPPRAERQLHLPMDDSYTAPS